MDTIIPCRSSITDRFPIASFVIRTPRDRWFEVACATDPRLFHTDYAGHRNAGNFYSSRASGVLGNVRGDTTWMMPPQVLRRFAGAQRLYYALATYGGRNGEDPRFTITPVALERVPSIAIGPDFSGRSLDRRRVGGDTGPAYGSRAGEPLRWGGDAVLESERRAARTTTTQHASGYDDGYDPQLWGSGSDDEDYADDESVPESMGLGGDADDYEDGPASYGFVGRARGCGCGPTTRPNTARRVAARHVGAATFGTGSTDLDIGADEYEDGAEYHRRNPDGPAAPGEPEPMHNAPVAQPQAWQHGRGFADDDLEDGVDYHNRQGVGQSFGAPTRSRPTHRGNATQPQVYGRRIAGAARAFRHSGYCDTDREESLPVGPASRPLSAAALELTPLDIGEKVRLLRVIGKADSGSEGYSAVAAQTGEDGGARLGLLWGLLLFSQSSGAIGRVLRRAAAREQRAAAAGTPLPPEQTLARIFGDGLAALLQATDPDRTPDIETRLAPIGEGVLWAEPWLARFRAAGALGHVQAAQNEEGVLEIFDRMLPIAAALGLSTPRQLALLVDRAVHMGVGAARSWIMRTAGPIRTQADRDATLALLGVPSLADFQRACGLPADGQWGPITHAALAGALRRRGGGGGPALLDPDGVVRALLDASRTTDFADRMAAIANNTTDFDDAVAYEVTGA